MTSRESITARLNKARSDFAAMQNGRRKSGQFDQAYLAKQREVRSLEERLAQLDRSTCSVCGAIWTGKRGCPNCDERRA